ncbi:hypothetical protein QYE76_018151 [Lolium multiflorum]|uniref:Uncharacterized protein n=1 Tax=Lolium multiflorum TaxID=4521 RepID=A0AAD8V144_LOLMU|nr:hypothetical protein QYE76_018151 [Lolium multiflorum]
MIPLSGRVPEAISESPEMGLAAVAASAKIFSRSCYGEEEEPRCRRQLHERWRRRQGLLESSEEKRARCSSPSSGASAPPSSVAAAKPGDWLASSITKRDEKRARSLGLISSDEGNDSPSCGGGQSSPAKRSAAALRNEDDLFDLDEGLIEPPPKKAKSDAALPDVAASEASAPTATPAAQVSTASSLSKGKDIPSTVAATTPPSGKTDLRGVISSLEAFASQFTSLEADKVRLQREVNSSSLKLEGANKIAAAARQEVDSLKEELSRLTEKLKEEEASRLIAEARATEKD